MDIRKPHLNLYTSRQALEADLNSGKYDEPWVGMVVEKDGITSVEQLIHASPEITEEDITLLHFNKSWTPIYELYDTQFNGDTCIDTGIMLADANLDWRIRLKANCGTANDNESIIDCNSEQTSCGLTVRASKYATTSITGIEVKFGNGAKTTVTENLDGAYVFQNSYGKNISAGTDATIEIVKLGEDVTVTIGQHVVKLKWNGWTNKHCFIGANVVDPGTTQRRFFSGYVEYLIIEELA